MVTILLVDDAEEVRILVRAVLRQEGYTVLEAGDGDEALPIARSHSCPIDLLITDILMPRLGGVELSCAFKRYHPEACVLFISGSYEQLDPSLPFLQKPFTPEDLVRRVRELL
jgi:two-component system cell cycle sensor histidine kinase/response regulator CckA